MPAPSDAPVVTLGRTARTWRTAALVAGAGLVTWGTLWGNDVHWPFAPMAQFAFRVGTNDAIHSTFLQARTERGEVITVPITPANLGIARAEIEGQQPAIMRRPTLLKDLADAHARIHPDAPRLTQLWLRDRVTVLRDGRAAGTHVVGLVGWPVDERGPVAPTATADAGAGR